MITSSITTQLKQVIPLLKDAKKLEKILLKIQSAEESAKEKTAILLKGQSLAQYSKAAGEQAEKYKQEVEKAKKYLSGVKKKSADIVDKAEKEAAEITKTARDLSLEIKASLEKIDLDEKQAAAKLKEANVLFKKADDKHEAAMKLKKQYEEKLADIKQRLTGL